MLRNCSFSVRASSYVFLILIGSIHAASPASEPVIKENFPDPCLAQAHTGEWYAFSTQSGKINTQLASSPDFAHWTLHQGYDALPTLPTWALSHPTADVWAPDVNPLPSGDGWVMYFAAKTIAAPRKHCIGTATSPNITGPYTPNANTLVCNLEGGGNIDPNLFLDPVNNKYYLIYKQDGDTIGHGGACGNTKQPVAPTPIYAQEVSPVDLTTPVGEPRFMINNLQNDSFRYDGPNVERPSVAYRNSTYYLLYNADCYAEKAYHIDYISCVSGVDTNSGIAGCDWSDLKAMQQAQRNRTLLKTGDILPPGSSVRLTAPGSMDLSADSTKMVFHGDTNLAWFDRKPGEKVVRVRSMYANYVEYEGRGEGGILTVVGEQT